MAGNRELKLLLTNASAVALLGPWYAQQWLTLLRRLASGIGRPGPARVRSLVAELRQRLAALYPRRSPFLRRWMDTWLERAFWLGEKHAQGVIAESRAAAEKKGAAVVPMVDVSEADGNQQVAAVRGRMEAVLQSIAVQMEAAIMNALQRIRLLMLTNPTLREATTGGIIRTDAGRQLVDDLQQLVTEGPEFATVRRLLEKGVPRDLTQLLERLNAAVVVSFGKRTATPDTVATAAGKRGVLDAYDAGILLASQENEVLYVEIFHPTEGDMICPYCAGIEYHVFYAGDAAEDPLGFPRLADLPGGGPPFHPNCDHHLRPWAFFDAASDEYERRLSEALSIPAEFFGPGAVEKINQADKPKEGAA